MNLKKIKEKIRMMSSEETRNSGNPHDSDIDRELARAGKKRKPEDIPKQDTENRGVIISGNVSSGTFISSTTDTKGAYKLGTAVRPPINHDKGFSTFPKRKPALSDYWELFKWYSMMEVSEGLRPDLTDALAAYRHFHEGEGKKREFSYERYVCNDHSGRITLRNAILDAQDAAINLWGNHGQPNQFKFTGPAIPCGSGNPLQPNLQRLFPYPSTENWQKTIGAHIIWLNGDVKVTTNPISSSLPEFKMHLVLHAEDQYNFNFGQNDIATGLPDSANGKFVVVGFAHGYRHTAQLARNFFWKGFDLGVSRMGINTIRRQHQPQNNRRVRNRI